MDQTPKKVVRSELFCFLCGCNLGKDRVRVFGKSAVDIAGLIKRSLDVDVSVYSSSELFICTATCLRRLKRLEKVTENFQMMKNEIRSDFEKGGLRSKQLRRDSTSEIVAACEPSKSTQNFLAEKSAGSAAKSLSFNLPPVLVTPVVPQSRTLVETSAGIGVNSAAKTPTTCTSSLLDNTYGPMPGGSFSVLNFFVPPLTSTPAAKAKPNDAISTTTTVKLTINYPSKVVEKVLSEEYQAIEKALAFGAPKRLAKAVVKCKALTKHVAETLLNTVNAEVSGLCSRNNPSLLRKCEQSNLKKFSFEALCEEWRERAPLFFAFLMTCCGSGVAREDVRWLPSTAVAGSVLLKQRNPALNATASVLGVLVKTGSMEVLFCYFDHVCLLMKHIKQCLCGS